MSTVVAGEATCLKSGVRRQLEELRDRRPRQMSEGRGFASQQGWGRCAVPPSQKKMSYSLEVVRFDHYE